MEDYDDREYENDGWVDSYDEDGGFDYDTDED